MESISAEGAIHWRVESRFQPRKLSGLPQANVKRAVGAKRIPFHRMEPRGRERH